MNTPETIDPSRRQCHGGGAEEATAVRVGGQGHGFHSGYI